MKLSRTVAALSTTFVLGFPEPVAAQCTKMDACCGNLICDASWGEDRDSCPEDCFKSCGNGLRD